MPEVRISNHARVQMEERGITEQMVIDIIDNPDQTIPDGEEKKFLVRVFVNII